MQGLTIRPYTDADAAPVAEMMNKREVAFGGDPYFTSAELDDIAHGWARDAATDSRLYVAPDGTVAAVLMVAPPPDGGTQADTFAGVHPDFVGRGIGRDLLTWAFERHAELHAQLAPQVDWTVDVGSSIRDTRALWLFERFGMSPVRYFFEMVTDLANVPSVELPEGFRVVAYSDDMARALYEADEEAFRDHWGHEDHPYDWWHALTVGSELFRPEHSRIAYDGDEIAALVLAYDNGAGHHYIGQVATRRPWRKRGLASALISASVAAAAADGKTVTSLGVDSENPNGALGVYERLGFAARQRFVVYRKPLV